MVIAAVGQLTSTSSMIHNLTQCRTLVSQAVAAGAKALFLPEAADYISPSPAEGIALVQPLETSPFVKGLQEEAKKSSLAINVGIHEPADGGKRTKNSLIWIDEHGTITQRYQKLHMFDIDIKDGPKLKESDMVQPGTNVTAPFPSALGKIGLTICYDLRFPEMALSLRRQGAEILSVPSAFTMHTGKAHWKILLQSQAIQTQSYVIAAAQVGKHNQKRESYGHSMIVSPWGEVIAELGGAEGDPLRIATAEIDLELLQKVRREMPLWDQRRWDVYPEDNVNANFGTVNVTGKISPSREYAPQGPIPDGLVEDGKDAVYWQAVDQVKRGILNICIIWLSLL